MYNPFFVLCNHGFAVSSFPDDRYLCAKKARSRMTSPVNHSVRDARVCVFGIYGRRQRRRESGSVYSRNIGITQKSCLRKLLVIMAQCGTLCKDWQCKRPGRWWTRQGAELGKSLGRSVSERTVIEPRIEGEWFTNNPRGRASSPLSSIHESGDTLILRTGTTLCLSTMIFISMADHLDSGKHLCTGKQCVQWMTQYDFPDLLRLQVTSFFYWHVTFTINRWSISMWTTSW